MPDYDLMMPVVELSREEMEAQYPNIERSPYVEIGMLYYVPRYQTVITDMTSDIGTLITYTGPSPERVYFKEMAQGLEMDMLYGSDGLADLDMEDSEMRLP